MQELLKDPNNYGLYLPANVSWKQGKFLDETRLLGEYPLPEKTPLLEVLHCTALLHNLFCKNVLAAVQEERLHPI